MEKVEEYIARKLPVKAKMIRVARGLQKADLVLKNASYLNVFSNEICTGDIAVSDGFIAGMGHYEGETEIDATGYTVTPGLIDAHIHLESSLVMPEEFAKAVLSHGTTTVIADPHEITNVMGADGIRFMLEATHHLPVDVFLMLPSCVPSTPMDEAGAVLDYQDMDEFFNDHHVLGLAEMMNYVGVVNDDESCISKILDCQFHRKKIDGHAPGLSGNDLNAYMAAGVYSDHENTTLENALEKLRMGQFVMIREGTAAKNLKALVPLLAPNTYSRCMFVTDDKHPEDLLRDGHIDYIVRQAISLGADPMIAAKVATHEAARYFLMNNKGAISPGYFADFVLVDSLESFNVCKVIKNGRLVFDEGRLLIEPHAEISENLMAKARDTFHLDRVSAADFAAGRLPVVGLIPNEIVTENLGFAEGTDPAADILKIAVVERHHNTGHIGLGYLSGYGLERGAVATSISHDSHNIIAVGTNDADIACAVNAIAAAGGGIVVVEDGTVKALLSLPIAGIISDEPLGTVNDRLEAAKRAAYALGVRPEIDPFMPLSFMSLPVIPKLKVTTQGVFDVEKWQYI